MNITAMLTNGSAIPVVPKDFQLVNQWEPNKTGPVWCGRGDGGGDRIPSGIIDQSTGNEYLNETNTCISSKCALLSLGTPIVHAFALVFNIAYKIAKLIFGYHFWVHKEGEKTYNVKERLADAAKDLFRIIASPFAVVGLELSALYGIIRPHDGRKLYASIERMMFGQSVLAPCFQPEATHHLFGGDINQRNAT